MKNEHRWYAVRVQPNRDHLAVKGLQDQGFEVFQPNLLRTVRHARKVTTKLKPVFPGYVFVKIDLETQRWRAINGTLGVLGLVSFTSRPSALPRGLIERMLNLVDSDGVMAFEEALSTGDDVRLVGGQFDDWIGKVVRITESERVILLMDMMSRKVEVSMPKDQVIKVTT